MNPIFLSVSSLVPDMLNTVVLGLHKSILLDIRLVLVR